MKIIIRTIQVLTALVLIFFSIGAFIEKINYQTETLVNADRKTTFAIFSDPDNTAKWLPGFIRFEPVKGAPMTEGSQWRLIMIHNGEEMEMLETVKTIVPGEQFSFTLENNMLVNEVDIHFKQQQNKTLIVSNNTVKPKGLFWRSLLPLFKFSMEGQTQHSYQQLAKLVEQKAAPINTDNQRKQ